MVQVVSKQPVIIRVKNKDYEFKKPYYLICEFETQKPVVKGSHLVWNIGGEQISYNQLKNLLKGF